MQNPYEYLSLMDDVLDGPEDSIIIVNLPERHRAYPICPQQAEGAAFSARAPQSAASSPRQDVLF
ncbi:hypothetical protein ACQV2E_08670 [Pantoea allii]|uniref:Uncharacterized protein n=1 Tax=Pantoea allii TaxID=574096 RepID=A0A2V2BL87_9GAMM|nr:MULTISPECIES: hypothetical protein [Pantoea]MBW1251788.1 hypothetical protein [Pantoea allii]MBW1260385.1 hypothetical protein [Pantoea allii]MBW1282982.1 hypothetical protein [Pantoea allii]MCH9296401.1 hypothetical protein [Pantoea allii]MDJ0042283.1 hypothetical protein [Pantoea allii]